MVVWIQTTIFFLWFLYSRRIKCDIIQEIVCEIGGTFHGKVCYGIRRRHDK